MHTISWRTSSYSPNGSGNCVEVGWRTSSYSTNTGGNCVELGAFSESIAVRDSKNRGGAILQYSRADWSSFIAAAKSGSFDLPA